MLMVAHNLEAPRKRGFDTTSGAVNKMIEYPRKIAKEAGGADIVVAYQASAMGFGLCDQFNDEGILCRVLAPTLLPQSPRQRSNKADEPDALRLSVSRRTARASLRREPAAGSPASRRCGFPTSNSVTTANWCASVSS